MEELRREFLAEAVVNLENLQNKLHNGEVSEEFERQLFRTFHTLKGTSQTFNLNILGKLAHEIENLLQAKRENQISEENFIKFLKEGVELLFETFRRAQEKKEVVFPDNFVDKIRKFLPNYSAVSPENLSYMIPSHFLRQLSANERNSLNTAIARGKHFYLVEVGFGFVDFAEKFKELREILTKRGEVIATFPSPKFASENKIGFQIFFVSPRGADGILEIIEPFGANLIFQDTENNFANDLKGVLAQAVLAGEKTA